MATKTEQIEKVVFNVKAIYNRIDELNSELGDLLEMTKEDRYSEDTERLLGRIEEFYKALPTTSCLDDLEIDLQELEEAYEDRA